MGQAQLTAGSVTQALITAMHSVVPRGIEISVDTPLDRTTLDSLGMIEVLVHLETLVGPVFDEATVRWAGLEPDYDPSMTVGAFAELLLRVHETSADATA